MSKKKSDDQLRAEQLGAALAKVIGSGWTYSVWENLGWHYCATSPCGRIRVRELNASPQYWADFGGAMLPENVVRAQQFLGEGNTPHEAIKQAVSRGLSFLGKLTMQLQGLGGWV